MSAQVAPEEIILQAVYDLLQTIDGTGTWTYDLRGQVVEAPLFGAQGLDATEACVGIYIPQSEGKVLTTRTLQRVTFVHVEGWAPGNTYKARQAAMWQLRNDIERAIVVGTEIRAAIIAAAVTLGTTAATGMNAVISQASTAKVHGDGDNADGLLALHIIFQIRYDVTLAGVR